MSTTLVVKGNRSLKGEVVISGSKNCALCLIAGALLCDEEIILNDIPQIEDIMKFIKILNYLNVKTEYKDNTLKIDASQIKYKTLNIEEISEFRASYYLIGALINRFKYLEISRFGGCKFVKRPINFHIDMFNNYGIICEEKENFYIFKQTEFKGHTYRLPYPSLGTTINALLYGVSSNKEICIENINTEIEVLHFIDFLKKMGADININQDKVIIRPSKLKGVMFSNIPDRIETGTFLLIGATNCDYLKIKNIYPSHNKSLLDLFSLLDIDYELGDDYVILQKGEINKSVFVETGLDKLISSDIQPLLTVFCLSIPRISVIRENVYASRFTHIKPLKKMGAFITESNQNILINGIMELSGCENEITDLRMGAAMVYAGLLANGISKLKKSEYINRGYENFVQKLTSLGAEIQVYEE